MPHNENSRVKIPALVHFTRLGYKYLSLKNYKGTIDIDTNIFVDILCDAINRINIESNILSNLYIESHRHIRYNKSIMEEVSEYFGAPLGVKYMPASKAQQKAVNKYVKANYDLYQIKMPKGKKDDIKVAAAAACESVNAYINTAIAQRMERDGAGGPQEAVGTPMGDRVSLPSDTLKAAQEAAQATGEDLPMYIARVVSEVAERDRLSHRAEGGKVNE